MITAGIDCGAKNTKTVILRDGESLIGKGLVLTGFDQGKAVEESFEAATAAAGISKDQVERVFGTGSGKKSVSNADDTINDIKAMGWGATFSFPNARTVADVGAEEGRAAKLDEAGSPVDFAINEKCAAGAGSFIESMSRALETTVEEMGSLALSSSSEIPMNAQCAIFAESEVVGLIHAKTSKKDISKAIHDSIASRIVSMIRRIGINRDIVMLGGVAYNQGFLAAMQRELNVNKIYVSEYPEFGMAIGAALAAAEKQLG